MRREEDEYSSYHHRKRNVVLEFFDRLFYNIGYFFYRLFRPVRHLFRRMGEASYRTDRKLQDAFNNIEVSRSRRIGKRMKKRLQKKEERQEWTDEHISASVRKQSYKREQRAKKRLKKRAEQQLRLEERMSLIDHDPGYLPGIERVRIILMFFMCFNLSSAPTGFGALLQMFCGFVPLAFYMLSGYLVLRKSEDRTERIKRTIKRSAIVFGILAVVYFALNLFYYRLIGIRIGSVFTNKRFWFNFLVLNVWQFDIGSAIWYVQALLYAYIIIYFLDKWKIMKFDWIIAAVLLVFAVVTGELCGLIRWEWHGYSYIPGNFFTRALPYILLGGVIGRNKRFLLNRSAVFYVGGLVVGIVLVLAETLLLAALNARGYYGHLIGMGVIAFSVCMLAVENETHWGFEGLFGLSRWHINCIYYLCQPVSLLVVILLSALGGNVMGEAGGYVAVLTFLVCFLFVWLIASIGRKAGKQKADKLTVNSSEDEDDI